MEPTGQHGSTEAPDRNLGSLSYTVPSYAAGIYAIVVTSRALGGVGSYSLVTSY
jgi:hypothetical protein